MSIKGGPGSRGGKFKISNTGKVTYFSHGNSQHSSGHGLAHTVSRGVKPVIKPIVIKRAVKVDSREKSPLSKLTRLAKPSSKRKSSKVVNHNVAAGHKNLLIKRG